MKNNVNLFKFALTSANIAFYACNIIGVLYSMWLWSGFSFIWTSGLMYSDLNLQMMIFVITLVQIAFNVAVYGVCKALKIEDISVKKYIIISVSVWVMMVILFIPTLFGGYNESFYSFKEYMTWK